MSISSFFARTPSSEESYEFNRIFHEDVLRALTDSYNCGFGIKSGFDFLSPTRFIHEDSGINRSLLSSVKSRELKGHGLTGIRLFIYETGTAEPYISSIVVTDTVNQLTRYYTLSGDYGYKVYLNGSMDAFLESEIMGKSQFEKCIIESAKLEQKYFGLMTSSSNVIKQSLPLKRKQESFPVNYQNYIRRNSTGSSIDFAKQLKINFNPRLGHKLLTLTFVDDSGFFYIRPLGEGIIVMCRRGFKDAATIMKIKWMFSLPIFKEEYLVPNVFIFTDMLTDQHEFVDVREIDKTKL